MIETGFFIRIKRDGKFQPVDIAQMTDEELITFFGDMPAEPAAAWATALARWIRDNVESEVPS